MSGYVGIPMTKRDAVNTASPNGFRLLKYSINLEN